MQANIMRGVQAATFPCLTDPDVAQRRVIESLRRRFGLSAELAAAVAGLASLGPWEARRG